MALDLILLLRPPDHGDDVRFPAQRKVRALEPVQQDVSCTPADLECVQAIRTGDQSAFESLYRERYPELFRAAVRLGHSRDVADEIVQDVFLSLWIHRTQWTVRSSVRAYLHGAIRFRAASIHRHEHVRRHEESIDTAGVPEIADVTVNAEDAIDAVGMRTELLTTIRALPDRQRDALILWGRHHMTLVELGDALGVSHVAARKLLRKAQEKLQAVVDRWEREPEPGE